MNEKSVKKKKVRAATWGSVTCTDGITVVKMYIMLSLACEPLRVQIMPPF